MRINPFRTREEKQVGTSAGYPVFEGTARRGRASRTSRSVPMDGDKPRGLARFRRDPGPRFPA